MHLHVLAVAQVIMTELFASEPTRNSQVIMTELFASEPTRNSQILQNVR